MPKTLPPLIDKLLRNALRVRDRQNGTEFLVFRCEWHGAGDHPWRPKDAGCAECNAICLFMREAMNGEASPENLTTMNRVVANACQAERKGEFDFQPSRKLRMTTDDSTDVLPTGGVVLTDFA